MESTALPPTKNEVKESLQRVQQITTVDTYSMLNIIKELETKLSEHHKQDVLLGSVLPRIEMLEKDYSIMKHTLAPVANNGANNDLLLDTNSEERILSQVQRSIDLVSEKYTLQLSSKLSSLGIEMDRLNKLLQVRPTTSDLSKIMLNVIDMNNNLNKLITENNIYLENNISNQIGIQMSDLISSITSNGELNIKGVDEIIKNIDTLNTDVNTVKNTVYNDNKSMLALVTTNTDAISVIESTLSEMQADKDSNSSILVDIETLGSKLSSIETSLDELSTRQTDLKNNIKNKLNNTETNISEINTNIQLMELEINNRFTTNDEAITSLNEKLIESNDSVNTNIITVEKTVTDLSENFDKYETLLQHLKAAEVLKTLNKFSSQHTSTMALINELKSDKKELHVLLHDLTLELRATQDEVKLLKESMVEMNVTVASSIEEAIKGVTEIVDTKIEESSTGMQQQFDELTEVRDSIDELTLKVTTMNANQVQLESKIEETASSFHNFHESSNAAVHMIDNANKKIHADIDTNIAPSVAYLNTKMRTVLESIENIESKFQQGSYQGSRDADGKPTGRSGRGARLFKGISAMTLQKQQSFLESGSKPGSSKLKHRKTLEELRMETSEDPTSKQAIDKRRYFDSNQADLSSLKPYGIIGNGVNGDSRLLDYTGIPDDDLFFEILPDFTDEMDEIKEEILTQAQYTAELCISYEETSIKQSRVLEMPRAMCEHLAQTAQALTSFVSNLADTEIVVRILKASPAEVSYDESTVSNLREEKIEQFTNDVIAAIKGNTASKSGVIRLDAREKFINKMRTALILCMSKHDQVLISGHSRAGALKIPTCIACDRPLLQKVRRDRYIDLSATTPLRPLTTASADHVREYGKLNMPKYSPMTPKTYSGGGGVQGSSIQLSPSSPPAEDPYVFRAGFKMPLSAQDRRSKARTPLNDDN